MRKLLLVLLLCSPQLFALELHDTSALVSDDRSCGVLSKDFIFSKTGGQVPVHIETAVSLLQQPDFLTRIQYEYAKMLPEGQRPEFTVRQSSSNTWFYINGHQERTDITEVVSRPDGTESFDLAYYTQGRRFFGFYQALIHIRLCGNGRKTAYSVAVYAYPENGFCRFFARHLQLVDRYFDKETDEISQLAVKISARLCAAEGTGVLAAGDSAVAPQPARSSTL